MSKELRLTRISRHDNEMAARLNCTEGSGLSLSLCGLASVTGTNARIDVWIYNTIFYSLFKPYHSPPHGNSHTNKAVCGMLFDAIGGSTIDESKATIKRVDIAPK